ncbi:Acyl-CoA dehydrogenase related to the alkylation response protein AidB [Mycobacterium rhizamassiliense]|jgi:alkylation response protein AidB-like acyl-CoA dehydrogenase|uniref:Acyl-CoA dehydrogenase related to the alkylation response protein AidB n=1 Tax=Mycobacterium rhizamassiliense TaxID=1841860 RepID=A0A2U3NW84_9MYCO|nr:acyl-CoA dehydrogenase family protein [Mycobacterium rhizamassiliense]SPM35742.1 Acyl-CoA dehydrogenase related to the alkylation response protein AidB [Mycobacterium rhizamassiliense]
MTVVDSPEKALFASTTQSFLQKEAPLRRVRELHAAGVSFDPAWWQRAAELGWTALLVPEELGGGSVSGSGVADLAMVAEQLGKTVAPGPLYPVSVVLTALVDSADAQAHAATVESLMSGETVAAWAVCEPDKGWAPLDPSVTATPTDSGFRIDGVKDRVEAGGQSELLLVVARCGDDVRQLLVPADAPGVTVLPQQSVDLVKQYARVQFDGVVVEQSAVVGSAAETPGLIERQSQIAQVLQCAEVVGILQTVFDFTSQWAMDRHTFGRPLASYQALKHGFADMKLWLEACRATTGAAVADIAARSASAGLSASIAKSYVGEMAGRLVQACVQMHGGIGVTWEHDLHLYLRRVALYRSMFGTPEEHNLRVYEAEKAARSAR